MATAKDAKHAKGEMLENEARNIAAREHESAQKRTGLIDHERSWLPATNLFPLLSTCANAQSGREKDDGLKRKERQDREVSKSRWRNDHEVLSKKVFNRGWDRMSADGKELVSGYQVIRRD